MPSPKPASPPAIDWAILLALEAIFGTDLPDLSWLRGELRSGVAELLVRH